MLAPGEYSFLQLTKFNPTGNVTFASADPSHPARIAGLNLTDSSNITLKDLDLGVDARSGFALTLTRDKAITVDHVNFHGNGVGDGNALIVRDSANITVKNSEVHHIGTGFGHSATDGLTFSNNSFHDLQADAIHGGGSSNVTIAGNKFTNFFPKTGDHPDAIQFFTTGQTTAGHDIVIKDNTFVRGAGDVVQGVFISSETGVVYKNVAITGNTIVGSMYNGIAVNTVDGLTIKNNVVQAYQDMTSWISYTKITGGVVSGNSATQIKDLGATTGVTYSLNTVIQAANIGDTTALKVSLLGTGTPSVSGVPTNASSATTSLAPVTPDEPGLTVTHAGTAGDDKIMGTDKADVIDGKQGADVMSGGMGNDTYVVDNLRDVISEAKNGGIDTVVTKLASYSLGVFVENVTLTGTSVQIAAGNELDNVLTSNGVKSTLSGGLGNDTLVSRGGVDTLTGGAGKDVFDFNKVPSSAATITDFTKGQDRLDLHDLLGKYHGTNPVADGWVKFASEAGGTTVYVDVDGPGAGAGMVAVAKLVGVTGGLAAGSDWIF